MPVNAPKEVLREAIKQKRAGREIFKDYMQKRTRLHQDLPDLMTREMAEANPPQKPDSTLPPPAISPVRSPLEGDLMRIQTAVERADERVALRQAAGGETAGGGGAGGLAFYGPDIRAADEDAPAGGGSFSALANLRLPEERT